MGCGIADFGRRCLKTPQTQQKLVQNFVLRGFDSQQLLLLLLQVQTSSSAASRNPQGQILDQLFWVLGIVDPSDQNQLYHTPFNTIQNMRFEQKKKIGEQSL